MTQIIIIVIIKQHFCLVTFFNTLLPNKYPIILIYYTMIFAQT
jgi:hypothetical protein